jgi:predicted  nucleic acid-binding Zn-ribbon protein
MESVLDLLVKIQGFDDEVEEAAVRLNQIPKEIEKVEKQTKTREDEFKNAENRIQELKKTYKLKELEIADNESKINKLNTQTFAVKTNEEYRAILSEVEFLKKSNHDIEEEMLGLMEEEEKLTKSINGLRKETEDFLQANQDKISELKAESEKMAEKQKMARVNLENNFGKLPEDIKVLYKRIAKSRGKAVCLITDNTCTGCFANLPHQFLNELKQRNKVLVCGNCGRILVYSSSEK